MHPIIRFRKFLFPVRIGSIKKINIPRYFPLRVEDRLPLFASQRIRILEIAHSIVAKTAREFFCFAVKIATVYRVPDYINPNSIVDNILQYVLNLGEPPTTSWSRRRQDGDESNLAGVALKC